MSRKPKILFVISYDAYADIAARLAPVFLSKGASVQYLFLERDSGRDIVVNGTLTKALRKTGEFSYASDSNLAASVRAAACDVVFFCCSGRRIWNVTREFEHLDGDRPLFVSCFAGVTLYRQDVGFSHRVASDIVLFNSKNNVKDYKKFCRKHGASDENAFLLGFPSLIGVRPRTDVRSSLRTVLFIDQNVVPYSKGDRTALSRFLVDYAIAWPDRELIVQCRDHSGHNSAHPPKYQLPKLLLSSSPSGVLPKNLVVKYDAPQEALGRCDLCLGFASTLLINAVSRKIPTAIIADFGWKASFGNLLFQHSGLEATFDGIRNDVLPVGPDSEWLDANISKPEAALDDLFEIFVNAAAYKRKPILNADFAEKYWSGYNIKRRVRFFLRKVRNLFLGG